MSEPVHTIRTAGFEDSEGIVALIKSFPEELLQKPVSEIVQNIDRYLVADVNGRVAGVVSWKILPEIGAPRHPAVEIQSLAVASDCHGTGIGRDLVNRVIERIRSLHPTHILVLTFHPGFFEKLGFVETPKEKLMHKI